MEKADVKKLIAEFLEEVKHNNVQQQSASNSTLLKMINDIREDFKKNYSPKEIDLMFSDVKTHLSEQDKTLIKILEQATKHNGRMSKIERYLLVLGCVTGTILVLKFPEVITAIKLFI